MSEHATESPREDGAREDRFLAYRTRGVVGTILVTWIVMMLYYLSFRHFERWDWTSEGRYTLSQETLRVLDDLEQPVEIILFVPEGQSDLQDFEELVSNYQAASPKITVRRVNPDRQAGEFRLLVERFQLDHGQLNGSTIADVAAVVVSGTRHWKVDYDDLRTVDLSSFDDEDGPKIDVRAEESFTGAIIEVTSGEPTKVCMTTGHGEFSVAAGPRSIDGLRRRLSRMNVDIEALAPRAAVDESCDALLVVGPERAFPGDEVRLIAEYLERGGNVLLALDPLIDTAGGGERLLPTGFESFLRDHGIALGNDLVLELDPQRLLAGDPLNAFLVLDQGMHDITGPIQGLPVVMLMNRSVRAVSGSDATELLLTSGDAYAEADLSGLRALEPDGEDVRGPVGLAAAVSLGGDAAPDQGGEDGEEPESGPQGGRLVVVGDADFLAADLMDRPELANSTLASSITGWLTQREALISVPPRQTNARPMSITTGDLGGIAFRVLLLLPAAMAFLGLSVWWSRRP